MTNAKAEAPVLWSPGTKSQLIGKDPDATKKLRARKEGVTEDDIVGWCHGVHGHEFKQTLGDGEGQGSLSCYSPRG